MQSIAIPRQVGYPVRSARIEAGLTQEELAARAGVSRQLLMRLEAGRAPGVQLDKLMAVLDALDLHLFVTSGGEGSSGALPPIEHAVRQDARYDEALEELRAETAVDPSLFAPRGRG